MTALLIAIEGGDGVGKNTVSKSLAARLTSVGKKVDIIDFPRYGNTLAGAALSKFLNGETERPVTPKVAATLYALDRLEFQTEIEEAYKNNDVVIFDRYVASNVAYQAAKVPYGEKNDLMSWVTNLELNIFGLKKPDLNILLRLDVKTARDLVERKPKRGYTGLTHDIHEADDSLQARLRENYEYLAKKSKISDWIVLNVSENGKLFHPDVICEKILYSLRHYLPGLST